MKLWENIKIWICKPLDGTSLTQASWYCYFVACQLVNAAIEPVWALDSRSKESAPLTRLKIKDLKLKT